MSFSKRRISHLCFTVTICFGFILFPIRSSAQSCGSAYLDELISRSNQANINTAARVDDLLMIASQMQYLDPIRGAEYAQKAYKLALSIRDNHRLAKACLQEGMNLVRSGQTVEAEKKLNEAGKLLLQVNDPESHTIHKIYCGYLEQFVEHYVKAEEFYKKALAESRRYSLSYPMALANFYIATLKTEKNDTVAANEHFNKALVHIEQKPSSHLELIHCLLANAHNFELSDNFSKAKELYLKAGKIAGTRGEDGMLGWIHHREGRSYYMQSRLDEAIEKLNQALKVANDYQLLKLKAHVHDYLSRCYNKQRSNKESIYHNRAVIRIEQGRDHDLIARSFLDICQSLSKMGKYRESLAAADTALFYYTKYNNPKGITSCYSMIGFTFMRMGEQNQAKEYAKKVLEMVDKFGEENTDGDRAYIFVAGIYSTLGMSDSAEMILLRSIKLNEKLRDFDGLRYAYNVMCHIQRDKGDTEKEQFYIQKYLATVRGQNINDGMQYCYSLLSSFFKRNGDYKRALLYLDSTEMILSLMDDEITLTSVYNTKAEIFNSLGDPDRAIDLLHKAISLNEINNDNSKYDNYFTLANIYTGISSYQKALENITLAINGFKQTGNIPALANSFNSKASILISMEKYEAAQEAALEGLSLFRTIKRPVDMASLYSVYANIFIKKGDYTIALRLIDTATTLLKGTPSSSAWIKLLLYKAKISMLTNQLQEGLSYLNMAIPRGKSGGLTHTLTNVYQLKSEIYEKLGRYDSAYYAYIDYITLRDSIHNVETKNEIFRKELQFEFEKKEASYKLSEALAREQIKIKEQELELSRKKILLHKNELALREKDLDLERLENLRSKAELNHQRISSEKQAIENEIKETRITLLAQRESLQSKTIESKTKQQAAMLAGIVLLGLISFSATRNYLNQRNHNRAMEAKNAELSQTLSDLKAAQKKLVEAEKEKNLALEKTRIARDMHDDIGSGLTRIAFMTAMLKDNPAQHQKQIDDIAGIANELVDNMSQIIWAMNPENNKLENLFGYLRKYSLDFFENSPVECRVSIPETVGLIPISQAVKRNVFLTLKEILNNVLKHSKATEVTISAMEKENLLRIRVSDNGIGFDAEQAKRSGNGLTNMNRRMQEIGGKIIMDSQPGRGTTTDIFYDFSPAAKG